MALNMKTLSAIIGGVGVAMAASEASAQYAYQTEQQSVVAQTTSATVSSLSVGNVGARLDSIVSGVAGGALPSTGGAGGAGGGGGGSLGGGGTQQQSFLPSQSSSGGVFAKYNSNDNGKSGGGFGDRLGVWANASYGSVNNTKVTPVDTRFKGDVWAINVGVDYLVSDQVLLGVAAGYAKADIDLKFNNGTYDEDVYSVSPYVLFILNKHISISGVAGYMWSDIEQTQNFNAGRGSTDASSWFVNGNIALRHEIVNNLYGTIRAGYLYSSRNVDAMRFSDNTTVGEIDVETSQFKAGIELAYSITVPEGYTHANTVQPYAYTDYLYDTVDEVNGDSDAYRVGAGFRIASWDNTVSGSLEGNTDLGRDDIEIYGVTGTIRFKF